MIAPFVQARLGRIARLDQQHAMIEADTEMGASHKPRVRITRARLMAAITAPKAVESRAMGFSHEEIPKMSL